MKGGVKKQLTIMNFDCILANPPYGKIGVDITRNVIKQNPDSNYAMLGTRSMFKPFYADTLACQFVQIGKYELGSNQKLDWVVEQAILLATNGWTEVVDNRKKDGKNKVGTPVAIERAAWNHRTRNAHLVGTALSPLTLYAQTHLRSTTLVQANKSVDVKLRNGYIYVAFETFEEACECAIDIISWKNPTDSHYRCVRWGFVQGLVPHERFIEQ